MRKALTKELTTVKVVKLVKARATLPARWPGIRRASGRV